MPAVDRIEIDIVAIDQASPALAKARDTMQQFAASSAASATVIARAQETARSAPAITPLDTAVEGRVRTLAEQYALLGLGQEEATAKASQFRETLQASVQTDAESRIKGMTATANESGGIFSRFGSTLAEVGKTAVSFAAGTALFTAGTDIAAHFAEAVTQTEALGAATFQLQSRIGGTAENASGMIAVFNRFGITSDEAQRSLVLFDKNLINMQQGVGALGGGGGSAFSKEIEKLGVAVTDSQGNLRPFNDILVDTIDKLHDLAQTTGVGADAAILFGKAGQQLSPILASLSGQEFVALEQEAQRLGLTLSQDNVNALRQLALANKDTEESLGGLNIQLGLLIAPYISEAAKGIAGLAKSMNAEGRPALAAMAGDIKGFAADIQLLSGSFASLVDVIKNLKAETANIPGLGGVTGALPGGDKGPQSGDQVVTLFQGTAAQISIDLSQGIIGGAEKGTEWVKSHQGDILKGITAQFGGTLLPDSFYQQLDQAGQSEVEKAKTRTAEIAAASQPPPPPTPPIDTGTYHQHTMNAQAAEDAKAAATEAKANQDALDKATTEGGLAQQVIQEQINVAKRESIGLSTQIAAEDLNQIPLKERQLQLQQQLLEAGNNIRQMEQQANVERAQQNAAPAANALEEAQFRQQELQARIRASAMSGQGVNPADINALVANAKNLPQLQLNALEANRPVTLAQQDEAASNRQADLATLPLREQQAQLAIIEGQQSLKIQLLRDEQQAQKDRAEIAVAGLQAELVAIQDINFQLKLKQDLDKAGVAVTGAAPAGGAAAGGSGPQVTVQFGDVSIDSQMDLDTVSQQLQQAVLDGLNKAMQATPNAASQSQSGARSQVPVGASGA